MNRGAPPWALFGACRFTQQIAGVGVGIGHAGAVELELSGEIFYWRGPAPYYYVRVPERQSARIRAVANRVTYGWGVIPVVAVIGDTDWRTSLFPKDGGYLIPIKKMVRDAEGVDDGDIVGIRLTITVPPGTLPPD